MLENETINNKKIIDKQFIDNSFLDILNFIDNEINILRKNNKTGIKFLKSVKKKIKILQQKNNYILKKNKNIKKNPNSQFGFLKPVKISESIANFTGWNKNNLYSRAEVNKYICDYIKQNNLQNPKDKRQIILDKKLKRLLNYNENDYLNYSKLQKYLKYHYD